MYVKNYALITGASSGIGKSMAVELGKKKINLLLVALPNTGLRQTAIQLTESYGIDTKYLEVDLTNAQAAASVYAWVKNCNVALRILINNAGIGTQLPFDETGESVVEQMLKLNNQAMVMLTHYLLPELKLHSPSYLMNVGSLASFMSIPGKAVYAASKSFVYTFSSALRMELKSYGVQVCCLCPGGTLTSTQVLGNLNKMNPVSRLFMQQPDQVAQVAIQRMLKGKALIVPGWWNRVFLFLYRFLPSVLVRLIIESVFNARNKLRIVEERPTQRQAAILAFAGW